MIKLHQTLHGYHRGHEQIATSVALRPEDSDALTQLSDLSGMALAGAAFESYLTAYPLPSGDYYVLARTWPDLEAPREGCVLTHSILIPMMAWLSGSPAREIAGLLSRPSRGSIGNRLEPIDRCLRTARSWDSDINDDEMAEFAIRYFCNGITPIIWVNYPFSANDFLISLLDSFWPSLRARFSCCTYSLQLRRIEQRAFDLSFAPAAALSRYSKYHRRHILGYGDSFMGSESDSAKRYLAFSTAKMLVSGLKRRELVEAMPADPMALVRLSVLDDLYVRGRETPAAAVAALDVIGALAADQDAALAEKRSAIATALDSARATEPSMAISLLAAISQRCIRPAYRRFRDVRRHIVEILADLGASHPREILSVLAQMKGRRTDLVAAAARALLHAPPHSLQVLEEYALTHPRIVRWMVRIEPVLAAIYLQSAEEDASWRHRSTAVYAWFSSTSQRAQLQIGKALYGDIRLALDAQLMSAVLSVAEASDVPSIMHTFLGIKSQHVLSGLEALAGRFPHEAWRAICSHGIRDLDVARIAAHSLPLSNDTFEIARDLSAHTDSVWLFSEVILRYSDNQNLAEYVNASGTWWLERAVSSDGLLVDRTVEAIRVCLRFFDFNSFVKLTDPASIDTWKTQSIHKELADGIFSACTQVFLQNEVSEVTFSRWVSTAIVTERLRFASGDKLLGMVALRQASNLEESDRLWTWLRLLNFHLPSRPVADLANLVNKVFQTTVDFWTDASTQTWLHILQQTSKDNAAVAPNPLEAMSLRLAMRHTSLPLSEIVLATFPKFYRTTLATSIPTLFDLFNFTSDWDKGKQLRKELIRSYERSDWPPGDLFLAAAGAGILDKIASRARRESPNLFRDALRDLFERRDDPSVIDIARELEQYVSVGNSSIWD
ncbi:hypothetical protein [Cupriavidus sp. Agwp_2]|uniref:GAP1-N1 domain-containing protein n=1 Tax=Cupriavidus sp. Agwp_2 TaxID=2897324 RepID=UPI0034600FCA